MQICIDFSQMQTPFEATQTLLVLDITVLNFKNQTALSFRILERSVDNIPQLIIRTVLFLYIYI